MIGAISYRSGAIWAYRFVLSIWRRLLDEFPGALSIETATPVESITANAGGSPGFPFTIHTPRGVVCVRQVVHATNAHVSHLLPKFRRKVTGVRAHMSAQRPGQDFPQCGGSRSWSVVYGEGFDYVSQRPSFPEQPQGILMLGGGFTRSLKQGIDQVGQYDDGAVPDTLTVAHLSGIFPAVFRPAWGKGADVEQAWSGILGITGDFLPFVGPLDEQLTGRKVSDRSKDCESGRAPGEWILAGFSGEGMVWAWLSGMALGIMMAGSEGDERQSVPGRPGGGLADWFPKELLPTRKRLWSADISQLAS